MAATNDLIPDFDDFERYYSDEMPAAEQRSLEGRMLTEPLVAEAYEGFLAWRAQHPNMAALRADLKGQLHARLTRTQPKAVRLWTYASAASVLLVILSYWAIFLREKKARVEQAAVAVKQKESAKSAPGHLHKPEPARQGAMPGPAPVGRTEAGATASAAPPNSSEEIAQERPKTVAIPAPPLVAEAEVRQESVGVLSFDTISTKSEIVAASPQPSTALVRPGSARTVGKSMEGRVQMEPSSLYTVSKDSEGRATQGAAESAKKKATGLYVTPPDTPEPVPAVGWAAYNIYLNKSTDSAAVTGEVMVTFAVSPSGALSDFVARGPEILQKEAIRIIANGPAWAPARRRGVPVRSTADIRLQFR